MVEPETNPLAHARRRRIARACGLFGAALLQSFFVLRGAFPEDAPSRELADDSLWFVTLIAVLLMMYPSFLAGLIDGVPKDPPSFFARGQRHSWRVIAVGVFLCALFALGRVLFDREAAELGGLAGIMRSPFLLLAGAMLIGWGWTRPSWCYLDDVEQRDAQRSLPTPAR